jgi:hypothetical protein
VVQRELNDAQPQQPAVLRGGLQSINKATKTEKMVLNFGTTEAKL